MQNITQFIPNDNLSNVNLFQVESVKIDLDDDIKGLDNNELCGDYIYLQHIDDPVNKRKIYINNIINDGYKIKQIVHDDETSKDIEKIVIVYPSSLIRNTINNDRDFVNNSDGIIINKETPRAFHVICDYLELLYKEELEIKPDEHVLCEYEKTKKIFKTNIDNVFFAKWVAAAEHIENPKVFKEYEPQILELIKLANFMDMYMFLSR